MVAFFEARLDAGASDRVDEHLAECSACRRVLVEYAAMAAPVNATERMDSAPSSQGRGPDADDRVEMGRRLAYEQAARRVGAVLSERWRVERVIGIGGMAQVFAAQHRNGRWVAVKVMRPELVVEPLLVERFLREGYVANKVQHPGAVAILDDDMTPDGAPFLVMELLSGRTLRDRLNDTGALPVGEALRIADEVLDVLASAHERGIVHRDIKPENLFETDSGVIKVLDFGIARLREQPGARSETQSGVTIGTVGYMPPEQARGQREAVDARSDVWAMGATLFTLLTGRVLHEADSANEGLLLAMTAPVPLARTLAPDLPAAVCALLDTALAFDPAVRFADSRAMQRAVRAIARAGEAPSIGAPAAPVPRRVEPPARPQAPRRPTPRLTVWVGGAAVALGLIVLGARISARAPPSPPAAMTSEPPSAAVAATPPPRSPSTATPVAASASEILTAPSAAPAPSAKRVAAPPRIPPAPALPSATATSVPLDPLGPRH
jgi:serine/threonine-protein kinase